MKKSKALETVNLFFHKTSVLQLLSFPDEKCLLFKMIVSLLEICEQKFI